MLNILRTSLSARDRASLEAFRLSRPERVLVRLTGKQAAYQDFLQLLDRDLAANIAEILDVGVERFAVASPNGDDGPMLFCQAASDKVVCLIGPWLHDPHIAPDEVTDDPERAWCRSFTLRRAPLTGIALLLRCSSDQLVSPEGILTAPTRGPFPETAVIDGTIDTLDEQLWRLGHNYALEGRGR